MFPAFVVLVLVAGLSAVPWSLQNPHLARAYVDPGARTVFVLFGAACALGFAVFAVVQIAVGLGLLASLYGRRAGGGKVVLTSPSGVLGHPRQRITVEPGRITVRLVDEPPAFRVYRYGVQRLYLTQGDATLHIVSFVRYSDDSRSRLVGWLSTQSITAGFEGDPAVLPLRKPARPSLVDLPELLVRPGRAPCRSGHRRHRPRRDIGGEGDRGTRRRRCGCSGAVPTVSRRTTAWPG